VIASSPAIEVSDLDTLRHSLGAESHYKRSQWGFRNRYCGTTEAVTRLVSAGLMKPIGTPNELSGGDQFYIVTEAGCDAVGLTAAQKKRAFED